MSDVESPEDDDSTHFVLGETGQPAEGLVGSPDDDDEEDDSDTPEESVD